MFKKTIFYGAMTIFAAVVFAATTAAQTKTARLEKDKSEKSNTEQEADSSSEMGEKSDLSGQKYRLLQSNGMLVETAYHQEKNELQHTFSFVRTNRRNWSFNFTEEIPLGSDKHQLSFSMPAQFVKSDETGRGFGDVKFEYSYFLLGNNSSRVTVSPGFGVSLPTGNARKELGFGAASYSAKVPVSVMITKRVQSNSTFEAGFTPRAKNTEGDRANLYGYEIGQSFVWLAKPKLNFLIEAVWEKSQKVIGQNLKEYEEEFYISPGVRWAYTFKNGLTVIPGVAVPFGIGASRGERGIFFSIAFEHSIKKER